MFDGLPLRCFPAHARQRVRKLDLQPSSIPGNHLADTRFTQFHRLARRTGADKGEQLVEAAVDWEETERVQRRIGDKMAQLRQRPRHFQPLVDQTETAEAWLTTI